MITVLKSTAAYSDSKQHFLLLDALRGIAAVVVVLMHGFEVYAHGDFHTLIINHGYLAVDFFFMLSGYVMAHAYDDRWGKMTLRDFAKRRLIRLHPLIVLGMVLGAVLFYFQEAPQFPKIAQATPWQVLLTLLIGITLIPIPPSMDIRGWDEMHPLNGPAWSLFFEYLANVLHALVLRHLPKLALGLLVALSGTWLVYSVTTGTSGDLIGGWSLDPAQLKIGFTRLLFPYMAGMLLRRMVTVKSNRKTFFWASLLLVAVLAFPRVGGYDHHWMNGVYESVVIVLFFPLIIYLGAIGQVTDNRTRRICVFLGDLSYPLYITHFPLMCVYYAWVTNASIPLSTGVWVLVGLLIVSVLLAYLWLKLYDEPVRRWLTKRFITIK